MFQKVVLVLAAFLPGAAAQVQLQFASPESGPFNAAYAYDSVVRLSNDGALAIGSSRVSSALGLYDPPVQHSQIALGNFGSMSFQPPVPGGSGNDVPKAAVVDPSGNIWIVGNTDSDDFNLVNPIVSQKAPYRPAGFVIELDPTGTKLLFATYLAGQQHPAFPCGICVFASTATAIGVDSEGNVYVGGSTNEADFPTTPGAFMTRGALIGASIFGDTFFYSFIVKISAAGKLVYSTLLSTGSSLCAGGSRCIGHQSTSATVDSVAADGAGVVTVSGIKGGSYNLGSGYVLRLSADGSKVLWDTSVGSNYGGVTKLLMVQDSNTNVDLFGRYVVPVEEPGLPAEAGTPGLFAAKLNFDGSTLMYSTDFGQSVDANAAGIALDTAGNPYLAGTSSAQFLTLAGVPNLGADFVVRLDASGVKPQALFRFPQGTISAPPVFDSSGRILLLGSNGGLVRLPANYMFDSPAIVGYANAASFALNSGLVPGELVSLFGFDLGGSAQNVQVLFDGVPAQVLYAGPNQINVQVPFEFSQYLSPGPQIQVIVPSGTITLNPVQNTESPGIFTTDGIYAAALNQDGSVNSSSNPAVRGSVVTLFGTGAVWPAGILDGAAAASAVPLDQAQNRLELVDSQGTPANILYFGTAPGLLYGVFQLNVQVPTNAVPPFTLQAAGGVGPGNAVQIYLQ